MEFQRILLYIALGFTLLMMWQAWQRDYGPVPPPSFVEDDPVAAVTSDNQLEIPGISELPSAATPSVSRPQLIDRGERIEVLTDLFRAEIDTLGGDLRLVDLLNYPVSKSDPTPFRLFDDSSSRFYVAQSGLLSLGSRKSPDHYAIYQSTQSRYELDSGSDQLAVKLSWAEDDLIVTKIYTFHRGSYQVDVGFEIENRSPERWQGHMYRQLQRSSAAEASNFFIYTYTGGVIYSNEDKYQKINLDEIARQELNRPITGGWLAMIEHYFLSAWLPSADELNNYYTKSPSSGRFILGQVGSMISVDSGNSVATSARLFVGPKLQQILEETAPGLELTVDYGILTIIAKPLFWLLDLFHGWLGNWGWSIVVITILIKLVFYKLSETSYRSMAQMKKFQPRLMALKERYGDDRQKLNEAMMKLYREEKINPLGGCLPILIQIPVFIALYWVLLESVELRQAPFILWLNDLSSADPYFVLPLLMGITMIIQHKLNPTPLDPIQARIMLILPIVFTIFFAFFPAGLVLYWVVNNTLSIAQQWYITRIVMERSSK
jgi:YidC/Oxa1 family membrane protein insertase